MRYILVGLLLFSTAINAANPSADSILERVRDFDDGRSYSATAFLRIKDKNRVREREFYMLQKDIEDEQERQVIYFHAPADVRGVSFLTVNHKEHLNKADNQWIYFPAFRKVRRIGSNDKRGSFMGSVFNYADLDKVRVTDYKNTLIGEDNVMGRQAWLIERIPVSQAVINKTGYHKVKVWIDKERELSLQQHYYNEKDIVFKTTQSAEIEKIQNIWTVTKFITRDLEKNKESEIDYSEIIYNIPVDEKKLSERSLSKKINYSDVNPEINASR